MSKFLDLKDEKIKDTIQMKGYKTYAFYCATYNNCAPSDPSRFSFLEDYINHSQTIRGERQLLKRKLFLCSGSETLRWTSWWDINPLLKSLFIHTGEQFFCTDMLYNQRALNYLLVTFLLLSSTLGSSMEHNNELFQVQGKDAGSTFQVPYQIRKSSWFYS